MSSDQFSLAENAFLSAVVKVMKTQAELVPLRERLTAELAEASKPLGPQLDDAERANEAVLKDRGIDETTPIDEALDYQEVLMREAIRRSGLGPDHPVVRATLQQAQQVRQAFQQMADAEAQQLGGIRGPQL